MVKKILAGIAACAVAAFTSVTAFAYSVKPDNVAECNVTLVGENGIYSSASELSGLTGIKLTATANNENSSKPSELTKPSGTFQVICDDVVKTFTWTVDTGDDVVFEMNDDSVYEAAITNVSIPSDSEEVKLVFENDSKTNVLNIIGIELVGVDAPKQSETQEPPKGSSDIVSEEPSSNESSESSSSKTETSSDSVKDETDNSNKPTGVGTGLAFAGIAIAAAAVVSLKKSK